MAQIVRLFVLDNSTGDPLQGANVALVATANEAPTFATTDADGKVEAVLPEGQYALYVTKAGYTPLTNTIIDVVVPPPAQPAVLESEVNVALSGLDASHKNIEVVVDSNPPVLIDVTGGDNIAISVSEVVNHINAALGAIVAFELPGGRLKLQSPTVGSSSFIKVTNDGSTADSAVEQLFGVQPGVLLESSGTDYNAYYNTFEVKLDEVAVPPPKLSNGCVVYGKLYDQASNPLFPATFLVILNPTNRVADISAEQMLTGSAVEVSTDENGYFEIELVRNSVVDFYFPWRDEVVTVTIPDKPSANIIPLLSPYLTDIELAGVTSSTIELTVGDTFSVSPMGIYSDTSKRTIVKFSINISDTSVLDFVDDSPSLLVAKQAGTTQLNVSAVSETGGTITRFWTVVVV